MYIYTYISTERGRERESGAIETGAHVNQYYVCGGTNLIMRAFFSASVFFFCSFAGSPYVWTFGIEIVSLERAKFAIVVAGFLCIRFVL